MSTRTQSNKLIAHGALYASHVVGDWYEVDSYSDGMCGSVTIENAVTTESVAYHWSVTHPTCRSQDAAREAARADLTTQGRVPNEI